MGETNLDTRQSENRAALPHIGSFAGDTLDDILSLIDTKFASGGSGTISENAQTGTSYTLALSDTGKLVSLANSSPVTLTIPPHSGVPFAAGAVIEMISNGTGTVTVAPGLGVTIKSFSGFTSINGEYSEATLVQTLVPDTWYLYGALFGNFIIATGGTITTDGNYKVHTFHSSGTFAITIGAGAIESLVIAGGGGGGFGANSGGGGGAGGFIHTTPGNIYTVGSYPITVGAGGAGGVGTDGSNGSNSVFDVITALGGGGGSSNGVGLSGGSGGGGGANTIVEAGGAGTVGQGNNGGASASSINDGGGGGGGAGFVGQDATAGNGGSGGDGLTSNISGSVVTYAGGGGGGVSNGSGSPGNGGAGGGGKGAATSGPAQPGTPNTGSGGGGGFGVGAQNGGSGTVILRYKFQ